MGYKLLSDIKNGFILKFKFTIHITLGNMQLLLSTNYDFASLLFLAEWFRLSSCIALF